MLSSDCLSLRDVQPQTVPHVPYTTLFRSRPGGNALARLVGACDLVITTYGVVARDAEELAGMPWHRVVCDEAQALKNHGTRSEEQTSELQSRPQLVCRLLLEKKNQTAC